jgi:FlaA1/EpsC-like NDP-sugar epimerase
VLECIETNVNGTANVIRASIECGVDKAIILNTDKAVNPSTTYGFSKALAERMFIEANVYSGGEGTKFSSCLYGNIAGSTGSVIPLWREILKTSDTVPVTDPDATRFWMTDNEACELVFNAMINMKGGEIFRPTLPAYMVSDLAEAMDAKISIVGLAENEKKHEEMVLGDTSDKAKRMTVDELRLALRYV